MAESLFTIPFGKYEGQDIEDIPDFYLEWLLDQMWFAQNYPEEANAIHTELTYREVWDKHISGGEEGV